MPSEPHASAIGNGADLHRAAWGAVVEQCGTVILLDPRRSNRQPFPGVKLKASEISRSVVEEMSRAGRALSSTAVEELRDHGLLDLLKSARFLHSARDCDCPNAQPSTDTPLLTMAEIEVDLCSSRAEQIAIVTANTLLQQRSQLSGSLQAELLLRSTPESFPFVQLIIEMVMQRIEKEDSALLSTAKLHWLIVVPDVTPDAAADGMVWLFDAWDGIQYQFNGKGDIHDPCFQERVRLWKNLNTSGVNTAIEVAVNGDGSSLEIAKFWTGLRHDVPFRVSVAPPSSLTPAGVWGSAVREEFSELRRFLTPQLHVSKPWADAMRKACSQTWTGRAFTQPSKTSHYVDANATSWISRDHQRLGIDTPHDDREAQPEEHASEFQRSDCVRCGLNPLCAGGEVPAARALRSANQTAEARERSLIECKVNSEAIKLAVHTWSKLAEESKKMPRQQIVLSDGKVTVRPQAAVQKNGERISRNEPEG